MTVLEIAISLSILITVLLGFSQALVSSIVTSKVNREVAIATDAARQQMEALQGANFRTVFAANNTIQADDPPGIPVQPAGFPVAGLEPRRGDPDGLCGRIVFPEVATAGGLELREDFQNPAMEMPRDLNGDGAIDTDDHSDDYQILPVIVRVEWRGAVGPAQLEFKTFLSDI